MNGAKQVAWIDSTAAKVGNLVELKEDKQFWLIEEVYDCEVDSKYIAEHERNFKNHRKSTDI